MQSETAICHRMWEQFDQMARRKCEGWDPLCWMCVAMDHDIRSLAWVLGINGSGQCKEVLDALVAHMKERHIRPPDEKP